jgi:excisionase family DNA binding protein
MAQREYLKAREVAEMLSLDITTVYKMCEEKVIPSLRIGKKAVRIPRGALNAYLAQQQGQEIPGLALLAAVRAEGIDPVTALEDQAREFYGRGGCSAHQYAERWRSGQIEDTPENADLAIEALALRAALDRAGIGDSVLA